MDDEGGHTAIPLGHALLQQHQRQLFQLGEAFFRRQMGEIEKGSVELDELAVAQEEVDG